jgi:hypothetical protein
MNNINIITKRKLIEEILIRWKHQYPENCFNSTHKCVNNKTSDEIYDSLKTIDLKIATPKDIYDIIGNYSWTSLRCDICSKDKEIVICFSYGNEYTIYICKDCVEYMKEILNDY